MHLKQTENLSEKAGPLQLNSLNSPEFPRRLAASVLVFFQRRLATASRS